MFDTKTMKSSDEGVSPVIGVILMVAITVILAAVIGTFVLDLAGNLEQSAQASVTFDEDSGEGTVTVQAVSMQNADTVRIEDSNTTGNSNSASIGSVGTSVALNYDKNNTSPSGTFDIDNTNTSGTLTAVGVLDGSESVLQTYDYGG